MVKSGQIRDTLELDVYGMTPSQMRQLSTLGMQVQLQPRNQVTVMAGDVVGGMLKEFSGTIYNAYTDLAGMPDVAFRLSAQTAQFDAVTNENSKLYPGTVAVADVMQDFATTLGLHFENNGVTSTLSNEYLWGSTYQQLGKCAKDAGISFTIDSKSSILAIWPKNGARTSSGQIPVISAATGMVKAPTFTAQGVEVTSLFNPIFSIGGQVQIQTEIEIAQPANGTWAIFKQEDHLESMVPHGEWFSVLGCYNPQYSAPLPE